MITFFEQLMLSSYFFYMILNKHPREEWIRFAFKKLFVRLSILTLIENSINNFGNSSIWEWKKFLKWLISFNN